MLNVDEALVSFGDLGTCARAALAGLREAAPVRQVRRGPADDQQTAQRAFIESGALAIHAVCLLARVGQTARAADGGFGEQAMRELLREAVDRAGQAGVDPRGVSRLLADAVDEGASHLAGGRFF